MVWFQVSIFLITIIAFGLMYHFLKDKDDKLKLRIFKILGLLFFVVFLFRLFSEDTFHQLVQFNMPEYGSNAVVVLTSLLRWSLNFCVLMLTIIPFVKSKNLNNILCAIVFPLLCLNFIFFARHIRCFIGFETSILNYRTFQFSLELVLGLLMCLYLIVILKHKFDYKSDKKGFWLTFAKTVPFILLMSIPLDILEQWFGPSDIVLDFMTFAQHVWIFMLIVLALGIHKGLKNKSEDIKYAALLIISVSMFYQYFGKWNYVGLLFSGGAIQPHMLPFHICNLATAIIPLALITKNMFLFSFTYYVNVAGALIAILMPNVDVGIMSYSFLVFAYEHSFAFILPILFVSLGIMPRTKKSNLKFAIASFSCYFLLAVILNVFFFNFDSTVNYFYLGNNFLPNKIGILKTVKEAVAINFSIGNLTFLMYPLFYLLVYLGFLAIMILTFFTYKGIYKYTDGSIQIKNAVNEDNREYLDFIKSLNGKPVYEPVKKEEGIMIKFENFSKKYSSNDFYSVKDFNLEVKEGEVFGFLGSNGAGKSTTIKSLVGILPFSEGKIYVDGYDVSKQPLETKKLIGYVPDNHAVYERLTGRQYINFIADLFEVSQEAREKSMNELAEKFNLVGALDKPIKTYSHGMKQKITIMSALVHNPKLWVLDEPLTGLDPQSSYEVKQYMREHANAGNTVFFSSHIIEVVEKICDRVAIIYKGKLKGVYDIKELEKNNESLVDIFINSQKDE